MKFALKEFEGMRELVYKYYNVDDPSKSYEMYVSSGINLMAAYAFLDEKYGNHKEKLDNLLKFYGYEGIK